MKLVAPFIQLPLLFDAARLATEITALGEAVWRPHPQGFPGNSMLPLIAANGDPANESFAGVMQPTPHLQACPYLRQVLASLGVVLGRSRLMRLSGHAEVTRHADQGYYWADRVRIHIPVITQPTVRFECDGTEVNMAAGECWIFDTWRQHSVQNDAVEARVHLVVDTVGSADFWIMTGAGRDHNGKPLSQPWQPQRIAPVESAEPRLQCETTNIPIVMTPWEINSRFQFILAEAKPHPALTPLRHAMAHFCRHWQSLWAAYGERESGWQNYRQALSQFVPEVIRISGGQLLMKNELDLVSVVQTLVIKVAVTGNASTQVQAGEGANEMQPSRVTKAQRAVPVPDPVFDRPVFVVSSPRSGSTMLFEALAKSPQVYTIGGESHVLIEGVPELSPATNGLGSNRLLPASATGPVTAQLRDRFLAALRDRDGKPAPTGRVRMLEKTPKNSLRVPFLDSVFPEGVFVYLYRDPCETLGSMIDAWQSQRFRTYPNLPGWTGLTWSLLLTPGWQQWIGKPLAEVVANQWATATSLLLDDLEALPTERVHVIRYDQLVAAPQRELGRMASALQFTRDSRSDGELPLSRYTLSAPRPDKWRKHADLIEPQLPRIQSVIDRARQWAEKAGR